MIYALIHFIMGQIPGAETTVDLASRRGYEAVALVVFMLSVMTAFAWVMRTWITTSNNREEATLKQSIDREQRLAARVTELENFVRQELMHVITETHKSMAAVVVAMTSLNESLHTSRPCFWNEDKQKQVLTAAADRIAEALIILVEERLRDRSKHHTANQ